MVIITKKQEIQVQCLECLHFTDILTGDSINNMLDDRLTVLIKPCKYCLKKEYLAGLDKGHVSGFEIGFNAGKTYAHL